MATDSTRAQPSRWAYARALLITLALWSQCVAAIPSAPLDRKMLARPEGQRAVSWAARIVEQFGGDSRRASVERSLVRMSRSVLRVRNVVLAPFKPLLKLTGSRQQWFLFSASTDITHRLRIEAREPSSGAWTVLYRTHYEDRFDLRDALAYRRVRGIYNPNARTGERPQYHGFTTWVAAKVLASHPEYDALRVSMERLELATRTRPNRHVGFDYVREWTREQLP